MGAQIAMYETVKKVLIANNFNPDPDAWSPMTHMLSGGIAGAFGGFISNPVDVVKTRIQTSDTKGYFGLRDMLQEIRRLEGYGGLFKGVSARMAYFIPSTAITWTTYEAMKIFLGFDLSDVEDILE